MVNAHPGGTLMTAPTSLSQRPERRFWGWGATADTLFPPEEEAVAEAIAGHGAPPPGAVPRLEEFFLAAPRVAAPPSLAAMFSDSALDRLNHAGGKSYADLARMWLRQPPTVPDWVAYPPDEQAVVDILDWASGARVAVIPYGGGSSVVGGGEPPQQGFDACVSLDMERLGRVLEIDRASRAGLIEGGAYGPELEAQLKPHGLTLRHFPQSFAYSTLGGWVATRAGGHFATLGTHIDDFVESIRMMAPAGVVETRRLPGSGAGPAPDRLLLGSEGAFGVITRAWVRLQDRPRFRAARTFRFATMEAACAALRELSQSGLYPSNCRLLDAAEVAFARIGDRTSPTLIVAFESADHPVEAWLARAADIVAAEGGVALAESGGAAEAWRMAFLRMPYYRDPMVGAGVIVDTFESAVTWNRFAAFYAGVKDAVAEAIGRTTGQRAVVSCRITHVYPDGPAPYFSYAARGPEGGLASALAAWRDIKAACNEAVVALGGTITHHHAVGRDHRSGYDVEVPALLRTALGDVKRRLDPAGVMNPGVMFGRKDVLF
jgi:alkyldihydroxyacetonephosphate synthase